MSSDHSKGFNPEYDDNKKSDVIYFGEAKKKENGSSYRKVELLIDEEAGFLSEKNKDVGAMPIDFNINDNVTLYQSPGGQQKIHCWLVEESSKKSTLGIHISRRTGKGVYGSQEVTLHGEAIPALIEFLKSLTIIETDERTRIPIPIQTANTERGTKKIITEAEFQDLINANIDRVDILYKLLSIKTMELAISRLEQIIAGDYKNEIEIQQFLKENIWMFGNDYAFVAENGRINAQNILDMAPQNLESYIDIIEVKLPKAELFHFDKSHDNYYSSAELTKAIAQTQNYIFELEKKTVDEEYQHQNNCKVIRPKGIILFGGQIPLNDEESKYLRILNSSYHNLQVITYKQLLEKAKNTLRMMEKSKKEV